MGFIQALLSFLGRLALCGLLVGVLALTFAPDWRLQVLGSVEDLQTKLLNVKELPPSVVPHVAYILYAALALTGIGCLSVIVGWYARIGAFFLLVVLGAETYFFHHFWLWASSSSVTGDQARAYFRHDLMLFLQNLAVFGGLLFILANGAGAGSIDAALRRKKELAQTTPGLKPR